jgi:hypothetical protein
MKALFGVVSLLVALAIVGLLMVRQMRALGHVDAPAATAGAGLPAMPQMAASGTVRQRAAGLEGQVANDVAKALNQGAAARQAESDKP